MGSRCSCATTPARERRRSGDLPHHGPPAASLGQHHLTLIRIADQSSPAQEELTGDPGQRGRIQFVVRQFLVRPKVTPKAKTLQSLSKGSDSGRFPRNPEKVLGAAGIPFVDPDPGGFEPGCDCQSTGGEHPHRSEGEWKERNVEPPQLEVALPEVGACAVVNGTASLR